MATVGIIDHIGSQLAGSGLGANPSDQLPAGCPGQVYPNKRKAPVERRDPRLLGFAEIDRVEENAALGFGGGDQVGGTVGEILGLMFGRGPELAARERP